MTCLSAKDALDRVDHELGVLLEVGFFAWMGIF